MNRSSYSALGDENAPSFIEFCLIGIGHLFPCCGWYQVDPNKVSINFHYGKFSEIKGPGIRYNSCCGFNRIQVSVANQIAEMPMVKVMDKEGNPICISVLLNFKVTNSKKFYYAINCNSNLVLKQAEATVKTIASQFPFISENGHDSLKDSKGVVEKLLREDLQSHVNEWGIQVINMQVTDLYYAPEIAQQMLAVQQANATMKARKIIIDNVVNMVRETTDQLDDKLNAGDKSLMARNLMIVMAMTGHGGPIPTMNIDR